ncbi:MAG: hypothetical protein HY290_28515 [Planctomycetia bacterium]|nr:hypothetical protein [Planctomycetia bacterium]
MKTVVILSTAFVTTLPDQPERERRISQYVSGFGQVAEAGRLFPGFDFYSVDNTVEHPDRLDSRLTRAIEGIPALKGKYYFWDNEVGRINKGSGLVVQWARVLPDIEGRYDFILHYEPRQRLIDHSFFERMAGKPDAYICAYRDRLKFYGIFPATYPRFWTGMFSMRTQDLAAYVRASDRGVLTTIEEYRKWPLFRYARWHLLPGWFAEMSECIESDLPRYVRNHGIHFTGVAALGVHWHEEATGKWIDLVDRQFDH